MPTYLFTAGAQHRTNSSDLRGDPLVQTPTPSRPLRHEKIAKSLDAKTYFAHPYSSWERGINENTDGLLRQYFPKKTDFRDVSWKQVKDAVDSLNNRPRKTRGYLTPNQLFNDTFVPLV